MRNKGNETLEIKKKKKPTEYEKRESVGKSGNKNQKGKKKKTALGTVILT